MRTLWTVTVADPEALMRTARKYGFDSVAVKSADGPDPWSQFSRCVEPAKRAGVSLFAWAYLRPNDTADATISASQGAERLIVDAETEWESGDTAPQATLLMNTLKSHFTAVDLTSFAFPSLHPQFPYSAFLGHSSEWWPQVYWADMGMTPAAAVQRTFQEAASWKRRTIPIGQIYPKAIPAEIKAFIAAVSGDIAFYSLDAAPLKNLQAAATVIGLTKGSVGDAVRKMTTLLFTAGYFPSAGVFDAKTEDAVLAFQKEHGIPPDGIMTPADMTALAHAAWRVTDSTYVKDLERREKALATALAQAKAKVKELSDVLS
jgi:murein L,D-transpeptidase YcbB/YkuD